MPTTSPPSDFPSQAFPTAADFESFLEREHNSAPGLYLKFAKKASGIPSITGAEAVEVALCYGWIDGRANSIDENWWTVRFTPRRAKSIWSQKNVGTVARLIEEGRMRPAGLAAIDAAKADGRWDRAYAGPANMVTPEDFTAALAAEPTAQAHFDGMKKSEKYAVLMPLATVSEKNRTKKIESLVQTLAVGKKLDNTESSKKSAKATTSRQSQKSGVKKVTESSGTNGRAKKTRSVPRQTATVEDGTTYDRSSRPKRDGLRPRT
ncbi:hypothetical protein FB567DRAFT_595505 [Paraphoma chrysanthemicola]|uniref:Uncharacterized protein n=1 Tax=Paraphoma chrysanthemicola TaxID=798071 RepID=A0A8K0QZK3_9PLEO|nr:hypothetical protein FB567DRAFT_595505 [Paraphoma chrysanthemicola]